jgi:drug/metabolite transporter (DMT)-like permease
MRPASPNSRATRSGVTGSRVTILATLALLAMTASWGSTFFLIHDLLDRVPVLDFLAVRFTIASVAILLISPRAIRLSRDRMRHAIVLGALYGVAQIVQTAGLTTTAASVSGFITGMYVVATPLFAALLLRSRIGGLTWVAVLLAITGLGVLTLGNVGAGLGLGYGEALTLVSAMLYALHIVGLGAWSNAKDALGMAIVQCIVIAVICTGAAAPGGIVLPQTTADWLSVGYMALFAGAAALLGQTWAQAHLPPTRTAIIMTMEPVFAAFFAVLLGGESATLRMFLGGGLVLSAMLIVELVPRRRIEAEVTHIAV